MVVIAGSFFREIDAVLDRRADLTFVPFVLLPTFVYAAFRAMADLRYWRDLLFESVNSSQEIGH